MGISKGVSPFRGERTRGWAPSVGADEKSRRGVWFKSHRPLQTKLARAGSSPGEASLHWAFGKTLRVFRWIRFDLELGADKHLKCCLSCRTPGRWKHTSCVRLY